MPHTARSLRRALAAAALAAACSPVEVPAPQPPLVTVTTPEVRDVRRERVFIGETRPARTAEVRARVRGFLRSIDFEVGTAVEEGQQLFTIEPAEFEARVSQAQASLAGAEAEHARAEADYQRLATLLEQGSNRAVSESQVDLARAERDKASASIEAARAELAEAELNLSYTTVHAPIAGRVGRNLVDIGNLVGSGDATLLTTVNEIDPLHVYFEISERTFTDLLREFSMRPSTSREEKRRHPVFIAIEGDEGFPHEGWIDFIDNTARADTGTVQVRAVVPNPEYRVYPGLFARIQVPDEQSRSAVLVREGAIGTDLGGKYVLVIGDGNVVERRGVTVGMRVGDRRVIEQGLAGDETYVVDGLVRARPGMPARVQTADQAAAGAPEDAPDDAPQAD